MSHTAEEIKQKEATAQFIWTALIVSFFGIQAIIWTIAITLTANDKSHAVVTGYDERALNWDEEVALRNASQNLGWNTELIVHSGSDVRGIHDITLSLKDRDQNPVTNAQVQLTGFHRALAGKPQQISLVEIADGVYAGKIKVRKSGRWQFEGSATSANDTLLINEQQFLTVSK